MIKRHYQWGLILPTAMIFISISSIATWSMVMTYRLLKQNDQESSNINESIILAKIIPQAGVASISTEQCQAQLTATGIFEQTISYSYDISCDLEQIGLLHITKLSKPEQHDTIQIPQWWSFFKP